MKLLNLEITAHSPLVFPVRKPGEQFRRSAEYIPGATIYGALGLRLEQLGQFNQRLFYAIRCHNAYPAWPDDPWSRPLPRSAEHPKGAESGAFDTLIDRVCWEQSAPPGMIFSPTDEQGRAWEADSGFHAPPQSGDIRKQRKRSVQQRVYTRVAINRRRGTAEDQRLFSPLALSEVSTRQRYEWNTYVDPQRERSIEQPPFNSRFLGSAVVPDTPDLTDDLAAISHLGGRITTGMGNVEVKVSAGKIENGSDIQKRVTAFTAAFRARAALYAALGGRWVPEGDLFTIDLLSDAILLGQGWLPTMTLSGAMLREAAGLATEPTLLRAFASYGSGGGWNVQWNAPKQSEITTQMGSVFVFQAPGGLSDADWEHLARLQLNGVGERRPEGFGQVRICDEFHTEWMFQGGV